MCIHDLVFIKLISQIDLLIYIVIALQIRSRGKFKFTVTYFGQENGSYIIPGCIEDNRSGDSLITLKCFEVQKYITYQHPVQTSFLNSFNNHVHTVVSMCCKHIRFLTESIDI